MTRIAVALISLFALAIVGASAQRAPEFVRDGSARVLTFPRMEYPPVARSAREQGAVVVRATLSAKGTVSDTVALTGGGLIMEAALANAKTWTFQPGPTTLILVYLFEIDGTCSGSGTFFRLGNADNIARITTCFQDAVR